ncbi:MAG: hypothetical protein M3Z04_10315 [Chloroflexota bacterium]|nr:hypothetical protein [Chloroflexota bacterium]
MGSLARLRPPRLAEQPRHTLRHPTTWTRRYAAHAVAALERQVAAFCTPPAARCAPQRGRQLTRDGKTWRGTLPAGSTQGVHLGATYLPSVGGVRAARAVRSKAHELTVARPCRRNWTYRDGW